MFQEKIEKSFENMQVVRDLRNRRFKKGAF